MTGNIWSLPDIEHSHNGQRYRELRYVDLDTDSMCMCRGCLGLFLG